MPAMPGKSASKRAVRRPRFRALLAVSLDGYIADARGGVEWLSDMHSPEIDFGAFMREIGATVYGRTTYDWAAAQGAFKRGGLGLRSGRVVVLTRRPIAKPPEGVEVFGGDVRRLAARLRKELAGTGKDIWLIGGGLSIAPFHRAGLVDRWELSIIPKLLGAGIPLFPRRTGGVERLRLTHSRPLKSGIIEAWYEPVRPPDR